MRSVGEGVVTMELGFGTGIYSFSEAALILAHRAPAVRPSTLRRWVSDGLAAPSFDHTEGRGSLLSFHELVSVEVVRRLRAEAVSLQRLHGLERALRELHPGVGRPFAYDLFFTDGADIWVETRTDGDPVMVEVVGRRPGRRVWSPAIETFARELRFGAEGGAVSWELSDRVEIDPRVQFGQPVIKGTRLPVSVVVRELEMYTPEQVADWHAVDVEDVCDAQALFAP